MTQLDPEQPRRIPFFREKKLDRFWEGENPRQTGQGRAEEEKEQKKGPPNGRPMVVECGYWLLVADSRAKCFWNVFLEIT